MGVNCHYAHGEKDLRKVTDPLPRTAPKRLDVFKSQGQHSTKSNFKTVLCKYYDQGSCKNMTNCSYAHGVHELREGAEFKSVSQPQNPQPAYNPPKENPDIIIKQLEFIMQRLEKLYPDSQPVYFSLKNARQLLQSNDYPMAADTLHRVMKNAETQGRNAEEHEKIIADAKKYGESLLSGAGVQDDNNYEKKKNFDESDNLKTANNNMGPSGLRYSN